MVAQHPLSFLAESYRSIRTVLLLGRAESPPRVVLITSAHPGDGKTTITLNLGVTLAQSGRSVVVVDADLRKGNCHTLVQNATDLLTLTDGLPGGSGRVPRPDSFHRIPPNPTDFGPSEMQEMLAVLRQRLISF
jgi:Mrp family chromosome partitioning ATPase